MRMLITLALAGCVATEDCPSEDIDVQCDSCTSNDKATLRNWVGDFQRWSSRAVCIERMEIDPSLAASGRFVGARAVAVSTVDRGQVFSQICQRLRMDYDTELFNRDRFEFGTPVDEWKAYRSLRKQQDKAFFDLCQLGPEWWTGQDALVSQHCDVERWMHPATLAVQQTVFDEAQVPTGLARVVTEEPVRIQLPDPDGEHTILKGGEAGWMLRHVESNDFVWLGETTWRASLEELDLEDHYFGLTIGETTLVLTSFEDQTRSWFLLDPATRSVDPFPVPADHELMTIAVEHDGFRLNLRSEEGGAELRTDAYGQPLSWVTDDPPLHGDPDRRWIPRGYTGPSAVEQLHRQGSFVLNFPPTGDYFEDTIAELPRRFTISTTAAMRVEEEMWSIHIRPNFERTWVIHDAQSRPWVVVEPCPDYDSWTPWRGRPTHAEIVDGALELRHYGWEPLEEPSVDW